ncbi:helitron_like_N domain-containing protein [Trichonephila clavipes]|nr:helitron_like_N domain-containing protein [Trichonephila clavipes]
MQSHPQKLDHPSQMPRKKSNLNNASTREARRKRIKRAHQLAEQIESRNLAQRISTAEGHAQESQEQCNERLQENIIRTRAAGERDIATSNATEKSNLNNASSKGSRRKRVERAQQLPEQIETRNAAQRIRTAESRARESQEQRDERLQQNITRTRVARERNIATVRALDRQRQRISRSLTRASFVRLAFEYAPDINYSAHSKIAIGGMDKVCQYCHALKFRNEAAGMCCASGKVVLSPLPAPPEPLLSLLTGNSDDSKLFFCGEHAGRFNAPTVDEVAVIMVGDPVDKRSIKITRRDNTISTISDLHRSYDALQYPLIFWQGQDEYHLNMKQYDPNTGDYRNNKVSSMNYYAHRIMVRQHQDNYILRYRQLFHQYIVDMYAKVESERLRFLRFNQAKLRSEEYIHLRDAVAGNIDGNLNPNDIGNAFILPSSYIGSPRNMQEYMQDAMTYVRHYGRPDLFITFTCNPIWEEIQTLLLPGQQAIHRHDLTARVFKQKLKSLIDFIVKYSIFGITRCWLYTIEWQKRGLPHAHILVWLKDRIRPEEIDQIISAEIPDPLIDQELFDIVTKHMIHGPCGAFNMTSPCMENGKCIFKAKTLGRLYTVHPKQRECFYLRLLLVNVPGPTSFEFLRTVNGRVFNTYQDACRELQLLEDDNHWDLTLADAALTSTPNNIRQLFAIILTTCYPSQAQTLWEKYKNCMTEDILHRIRQTNQSQNIDYTPEMYNEALVLIEDLCVLISNLPLNHYGMPSPNRPATDLVNTDLQRENQYDHGSLATIIMNSEPLLTAEQKIIYDRIMLAVAAEQGGFFSWMHPVEPVRHFNIVDSCQNTVATKNRISSSIVRHCGYFTGWWANSTFNIQAAIGRS